MTPSTVVLVLAMKNIAASINVNEHVFMVLA